MDSVERDGLSPKGNVPNLRFPEFQGEWEKCTFDKIAQYKKGPFGSALKKDIFVPQSEDTIKVYEQQNAIKKDWTLSRYYITKGYFNSHMKQFVAKAGDLIVSCAGTIGEIYELPQDAEEGVFNQALMRVQVNDEAVNKEIFITVFSSMIDKFSKIYSNGSAIKNIPPFADLKKTQVFLPCKEEQKKIAKLLALLDERIATQNKIIEDLKKLKSAIVEKVFCSPNQEYPMCRIEGFEHALSTYKMSDFSSRIATKNKDSKCSLVLTIAAQYGLVNQESFFNKSVASENLTGYYLLHKGEFAYNRSYSAGYDWGAVKRLENYDEGVLSTLYICFKINETIVDSDYLAYYFESTKWHRGLSDIAGEGARNHGLLNVSMADYFNTKHRFPVIEEQKAIAKILNAITEKERKATLLGGCYQKQKQYLLRQMFI